MNNLTSIGLRRIGTILAALRERESLSSNNFPLS